MDVYTELLLFIFSKARFIESTFVIWFLKGASFEYLVKISIEAFEDLLLVDSGTSVLES